MFLLEKFIYSKGYRSSHLHVSILFLGGNPMKSIFKYWSCDQLDPWSKLNMFLTLLVCYQPCNVVAYKLNI
jgi:hypothetical protein